MITPLEIFRNLWCWRQICSLPYFGANLRQWLFLGDRLCHSWSIWAGLIAGLSSRHLDDWLKHGLKYGNDFCASIVLKLFACGFILCPWAFHFHTLASPIQGPVSGIHCISETLCSSVGWRWTIRANNRHRGPSSDDFRGLQNSCWEWCCGNSVSACLDSVFHRFDGYCCFHYLFWPCLQNGCPRHIIVDSLLCLPLQNMNPWRVGMLKKCKSCYCWGASTREASSPLSNKSIAVHLRKN